MEESVPGKGNGFSVLGATNGSAQLKQKVGFRDLHGSASAKIRDRRLESME